MGNTWSPPDQYASRKEVAIPPISLTDALTYVKGDAMKWLDVVEYVARDPYNSQEYFRKKCHESEQKLRQIRTSEFYIVRFLQILVYI